MQSTQSKLFYGSLFLSFAFFKAYQSKWANRILALGTLASVPSVVQLKDYKFTSVHLQSLGAAFAGFALGAVVKKNWILASLTGASGACLYKLGEDTWPKIGDAAWREKHPESVKLLAGHKPQHRVLYLWKLAEQAKTVIDKDAFRELCKQAKNLVTLEELKEHLLVINDREWFRLKNNGSADPRACKNTWCAFVETWMEEWKETAEFRFEMPEVWDFENLLDDGFNALWKDPRVRYYGPVVDGKAAASPERKRLEQKLQVDKVQSEDRMEAYKNKFRAYKLIGERDIDQFIREPRRETEEDGEAMTIRWVGNLDSYNALLQSGALSDYFEGEWLGRSAEEALQLRGLESTPTLISYVKHFL